MRCSLKTRGCSPSIPSSCAQRRDLTDKVVIGLGVMLFACVVLYILWRRLRHVFGFLSAITYLFGGGSDAGFAADGPDLTSDGGTGTYHATEDL